MVKCQRDVILWISPTTGSPGALGHLAADMQPVLVVPSAPGLHSGWGSGRNVKYCSGEFGKDKLCRVVVQTAKENPALSPFLSFPFGTQISIFPFLTESRGESVCLRGGHDRRSMLVQVMMTADPLVSVAFYETDPHSNTSTPQVPAWETGVS